MNRGGGTQPPQFIIFVKYINLNVQFNYTYDLCLKLCLYVVCIDVFTEQIYTVIKIVLT